MSPVPEPSSRVATPVAGCCAADTCGGPLPALVRDAGWHRAATAARVLSWVSLPWVTGEGVLGLIAGGASGSISLIGWAIGSAIEGLAAVMVIWRFTGARRRSRTAEYRAQKVVALSFFLLTPFLVVQSVRELLTGRQIMPSVLGIVLTAASLLVMPALGVAKTRLAARLHSRATAGDGVQNLLCAAQAGAVLSGLALTAARGWAWVDPTIGLAVAAVAAHQGRQAWRGRQGCC